ncbi:bifunctional folylpolyglutamate synthase/dihydrofolate synthase [Corynebacterium cystitidis]|uniref:bifunctional folylpolyglutamate synthase/dihydrofolate synthase n=1 Tax=Corynebacterium cystitidis TaxID=35757 RepID=UPI00211E0274|nr:Mur ligase family protein [Corynebacterium cystitidis]
MTDNRPHSDDEQIKRILEAIDAAEFGGDDADEEGAVLPEQPDFDVEATEAGRTLNLGGTPVVGDGPVEVDGLVTETVEPIERPVTDDDRAALASVENELAQRASEREIEPSTEKIALLLDFLGTPQQIYKVIHVAGTNGKTSTVRMIATLLEAFHRRVGYFVSPQLSAANDMISIDGEDLHPADFVRIYQEIKPFVELVDARYDVPLSRFEVLTAIAYAAFADAPVDVAVIEAGMGGQWDSTNVVNADVNVITPVGLDHTDYLGGRIAEIAANKAGIIRNPDAVAIVAAQPEEAVEPILARAVEVDAAVARYGVEFTVAGSAIAVGGQTAQINGLGGLYDDVFVPLSGAHQAANAAVALAAVEAFFGAHAGRQLDVETIRHGFAAVEVPGRLQRMDTTPTTFVDSTHNPAGAQALAAALERDFHFNTLIGVVGVLEDKDAVGILRALEPVLSVVVVAGLSSPRALDVFDLADMAREVFGDERVFVGETLAGAYATARELAVEESGVDEAQSGTGIVLTGSGHVVGQARELFAKDAD